MIVIAIIMAAVVVVSYTCCKVSYKEDELRRYENEDYGIWDEWRLI